MPCQCGCFWSRNKLNTSHSHQHDFDKYLSVTHLLQQLNQSPRSQGSRTVSIDLCVFVPQPSAMKQFQSFVSVFGFDKSDIHILGCSVVTVVPGLKCSPCEVQSSLMSGSPEIRFEHAICFNSSLPASHAESDTGTARAGIDSFISYQLQMKDAQKVNSGGAKHIAIFCCNY